MKIFIDGYNLIFAASNRVGGFDMSDPEAARDKLLSLLARYRAARSGRIVVFFDGSREAAHLPRREFVRGIEVVFSDAPSDADADIKNAVSHDDQPRNIQVVSSDIGIQEFARRYGVRVVDALSFLDMMFEASNKHRVPQDEPVEKYGGAASKDEIDYWLSVFGDETGDDEG